MKICLMVLILISMSSCSNYFTRKKCEKKNWFDYGQSVALKGQRLGSDKFYLDCKKAEAEFDEMSADQGFKKGMNIYCAKDAPYNYGKQGKLYNFDFCDFTYISKMKAAHVKGLRVYCRSSNGFPEGIKGKPYNELCPEDLEAKFLIGFNKGRIKFLRSEIVKHSQEISDIEGDLRTENRQLKKFEDELHSLNVKYSADPSSSEVVISGGSIYIGRRSSSQFSTKEELDAEKNRLSSEIRDHEYSIKRLKSKRDEARAKIREYKKEISLLTN